MDMTWNPAGSLWRSWPPRLRSPAAAALSALVGAIGTALGNMVGSLTVGKKKYADVEEEIIALQGKVRHALQKELLDLVAGRRGGL